MVKILNNDFEYGSNWTQEFPTKPGYYWFYGYRYGRINCGSATKPELQFVEVWKNGHAVAGGQFIYKSELEDAWFAPAEVPEFPEVEPVGEIWKCNKYHNWEGEKEVCPECGSTEVEKTIST